MPFVVPEAGSFLLPGGPIGCLLVHGFTSMPEEMRWLGDDLAQRGYTVLGVRLAGHATHPRDLARTRWEDWMISVEEGLALLGGITEQAFVLGLSLGGNVTLLAAAHYPMKGAVVMSTPYRTLSRGSLLALRLASWLRPLVRKGVPQHPTLGERREADYPAYAEYPTRILFEVVRLQAKVREALAAVKVPVLLIHSQQDAAVPAESVQQISDHLGTSDKEVVLLEGFDHALVRDPRREEVFEVIADFIGRVSGAE